MDARNQRTPPKQTGPEGEPELTATEARQGQSLNRMRYVLGIGLVLVIFGFIASYMLAPS
ncbi:hypothetical protein [Prosthecomicrobium pneumaticum]|uniref:Uncharacterized protein n=1 Tax=Prosthecomicrobium pneumaticum TaxID=81895 RepID=A0A7W9FNM6_9HYPH|nr:hypothetical protein [Prosthecomicrobium pneumaticum]MBB5754003.1 hypothetical protein [Prosthecomicrobium pneumaticum]